jgi:hypothetical protein
MCSNPWIIVRTKVICVLCWIGVFTKLDCTSIYLKMSVFVEICELWSREPTRGSHLIPPSLPCLLNQTNLNSQAKGSAVNCLSDTSPRGKRDSNISKMKHSSYIQVRRLIHSISFCFSQEGLRVEVEWNSLKMCSHYSSSIEYISHQYLVFLPRKPWKPRKNMLYYC